MSEIGGIFGVIALVALAWALMYGPLADPYPTCHYVYKVGATPCK